MLLFPPSPLPSPPPELISNARCAVLLHHPIQHRFTEYNMPLNCLEMRNSFPSYNWLRGTVFLNSISVLPCPLISFLLTLNSSQNLLLSILMMGHSRVGFGDVTVRLPSLSQALSLSFRITEPSALTPPTGRHTLRHLH
jgi:hypothetical protein